MCVYMCVFACVYVCTGVCVCLCVYHIIIVSALSALSTVVSLLITNSLTLSYSVVITKDYRHYYITQRRTSLNYLEEGEEGGGRVDNNINNYYG